MTLDEWRRQQAPPPEPDLARGRQLNQPRRRWLIPALASIHRWADCDFVNLVGGIA